MWTQHLPSIGSFCPHRSLMRTVSSSFPNQGNQAQGTDGAFSFSFCTQLFSTGRTRHGLTYPKSGPCPPSTCASSHPHCPGPSVQVCCTELSAGSWGLSLSFSCPQHPSKSQSAIFSGREGTPCQQPTAPKEGLAHGLLLIFTVTLKPLLCPLCRGN